MSNLKKYIGITSILPDNLFQSGCFQQSLVTYKMLELAGYNPVLLIGINNNETTIQLCKTMGFNIEIMSLQMDVTRFSMVIHISGNLMAIPDFANLLKQNKVKIVQMVCGNYYYLIQEHMLFDVHNVTNDLFDNSIDEYWILPMYTFAVDFISSITQKPCHILPYCWNPFVIEEYNRRQGFNVINTCRTDKKRILLIMEPNLSMHKTCMVPLAIANKVHCSRPGLFSQVFCFCSKKTKGFEDYLSHLQIKKDNLLVLHEKIPFMNVLDQLIKQDVRPVVLSHQQDNDLNFLHLEAFHLRHIVVHNCKPFQEAGFYYENNNVGDGSRALVNALTLGDPLDVKQNNGIEQVLARFAINNPDTLFSFQNKIENISPSSNKLQIKGVDVI
jgi:hypothetical protein